MRRPGREALASNVPSQGRCYELHVSAHACGSITRLTGLKKPRYTEFSARQHAGSTERARSMGNLRGSVDFVRVPPRLPRRRTISAASSYLGRLGPRSQPARAVAETAPLAETPCVPFLGRQLPYGRTLHERGADLLPVALVLHEPGHLDGELLADSADLEGVRFVGGGGELLALAAGQWRLAVDAEARFQPASCRRDGSEDEGAVEEQRLVVVAGARRPCRAFRCRTSRRSSTSAWRGAPADPTGTSSARRERTGTTSLSLTVRVRTHLGRIPHPMAEFAGQVRPPPPRAAARRPAALVVRRVSSRRPYPGGLRGGAMLRDSAIGRRFDAARSRSTSSASSFGATTTASRVQRALVIAWVCGALACACIGRHPRRCSGWSSTGRRW